MSQMSLEKVWIYLLRLCDVNHFHVSAPEYSLSSYFENIITQVTKTKFDGNNNSNH